MPVSPGPRGLSSGFDSLRQRCNAALHLTMSTNSPRSSREARRCGEGPRKLDIWHYGPSCKASRHLLRGRLRSENAGGVLWAASKGACPLRNLVGPEVGRLAGRRIVRWRNRHRYAEDRRRRPGMGGHIRLQLLRPGQDRAGGFRPALACPPGQISRRFRGFRLQRHGVAESFQRHGGSGSISSFRFSWCCFSC